jgi:pantetheine-phosphate adenylyltransferase
MWTLTCHLTTAGTLPVPNGRSHGSGSSVPHVSDTCELDVPGPRDLHATTDDLDKRAVVKSRPPIDVYRLVFPIVRTLYSGSFDPVTQGHQDVLRRAAGLFDEVVVCVMSNSNKTGRFPITERLDRLRAAASGLSNVTIDSHTSGLLVDYCRRVGIDVVIRGVRNGHDLDYEMSMAHMNHELGGVETVFIAADPAQSYMSSTLVTAVDAAAGDGRDDSPAA